MLYLISRVATVAGVAGAILFVLAGFMLTYEVAARYFFVRPTIWAAELSQLCLIWGCLLCMPWVLAIRRHIAVNAVTSLMPLFWKRLMERLSLVLLLVFSMIVMFWGWEIFFDSFQRGRTTGSLLNLPTWIAELSVPVGFAMMAVQCLIELFKVRPESPETEELIPD